MAIVDQRALIERARHDVDEVLRGLLPSKLLSVELARAMLRRVPNVLRAVELLSANDLVAEARALGRILVETSIRLAWVLQRDGVDRSAADRERFAQCLVHIDEREAQKTALLVAKTDAEAPEPQMLDEFTKEVLDTLEGRKRDAETALDDATDNQAGPTIRAMAEQAGGPMFSTHYVQFYKFFCLDAHASIQGGIETLDPNDPSAHDISLSMINEATHALLDIGSQLLGPTELGVFVREFRVQLDAANARRMAEHGG